MEVLLCFEGTLFITVAVLFIVAMIMFILFCIWFTSLMIALIVFTDPTIKAMTNNYPCPIHVICKNLSCSALTLSLEIVVWFVICILSIIVVVVFIILVVVCMVGIIYGILMCFCTVKDMIASIFAYRKRKREREIENANKIVAEFVEAYVSSQKVAN